jgi:hypothetical protein
MDSRLRGNEEGGYSNDEGGRSGLIIAGSAGRFSRCESGLFRDAAVAVMRVNLMTSVPSAARRAGRNSLSLAQFR